ncbi:MAG: signal peptidase I [Lachnospiraceae bacterium]|nr:signal peptidase I [Lachnospiraceae bacterium]
MALGKLKARKSETVQEVVEGKSIQRRVKKGRRGKYGFRKKRTVKSVFSEVLSIFYLLVQIAVVAVLGFVLVWAFGVRLDNSGAAMQPNIENGEVVLVNRIAYSVFSPRRAHVVAFWPNGNENAGLSIRRVIALPGETIQIIEGKVYIDEEETVIDGLDDGLIVFAGLADEPIALGENEFFVIGDNHNSSSDSRVADIGLVQREHIYGRVWFAIGDNFGLIRG